jgi:RHS repeat-associated protein
MNSPPTGETITYQYDALKRLVAANGLNWSEAYTYDGYGNLTQMHPTGTTGAPSLSLTVALDANNVPTNRINATGVTYDNNGNQTLGFGNLSLTYDAANRVTAVGGSQTAAYAYDSDNRRIYSRNASGSETIYFYGVDGKKLATYAYAIITSNGNPEVQLTQQSENVYFLGKLIAAEGNSVQTGRLGSVRSGGPRNLGYQAQYPYGVEYSLTANDREKYATYTRDSATGLDYAMNRYYSSQWGRFLSPDPSGASIAPGNPQSWNRYVYVSGDPANHADPTGLLYDGSAAHFQRVHRERAPPRGAHAIRAPAVAATSKPLSQSSAMRVMGWAAMRDRTSWNQAKGSTSARASMGPRSRDPFDGVECLDRS